MRIDFLNLTAYGCFTNTDLDFAGTGRNMVVVYGANEAGKSSALNAIRHWLFGFEKGIEYVAFIHKPASLRIKGTMSDGAGKSLTAIRRKGNKDTILDADGKTPLKDGAFDPFLKSISVTQFEESFGLNLEQLKVGGRDLAAGKGNLGEALFSAASGVVNLRKLRSAITMRKEALFVAPRGVNPSINADLRAFSEAKSAWEASLVPPADAAKLEGEVSSCRVTLDSLKTRMSEVLASRDILSRLLRGRSLVLKHDDLQRLRYPLRDIVPLDPSFAVIHTQVSAQHGKALTLIANLDERLKILNDEIDSTLIDGPILAAAENVTALAGQQQSVKKFDSDLPADEQLVRSKLGEAKQVLRDLGLPVDDPESYLEKLRLNDLEKRRLRKLSNDYAKLWESSTLAQRTKAERQSDLEAAISRLETSVEPVSTTAVVAAIEEVDRTGDFNTVSNVLRHEIDGLSTEIESAKLRLGCFRTTVEIPTIVVPSFEVIGYHRDRLDTLDREVADLRKLQRELDADAAQVGLDLVRLEATGSIPQLEELKIAREKRDVGWGLIRRTWLTSEWDARAAALFVGEETQPEEVARSYSDAVMASDVLADRLIAEADRVRERLELQQRLQSIRQQSNSLDADAARTSKVREDYLQEWLEPWSASSVTPKTPREMIDWRRAWDYMCERVGTLSVKQAELIRITAEIETRIDRLRRVLFNAGELTEELEGIIDLGELTTFARRKVKQHEQAMADRRLLEQRVVLAEDSLRVANFQLQCKQEELAGWSLEWSAATSRFANAGLANIRAEQLDEILGHIDDFYKQMDFRRTKSIELERRRIDRTQWQTQMVALADRLGEQSTLQSAKEPTGVVAAWAFRLKTAESARERLTDRTTQRDTLERQRPDHEAELAAAKIHFDRLINEAKVETVAELPERITLAAELREIDRRIETEYRSPLRELAAETGCSADELERQISEVIGRNLRQESDEAESDLSNLDQQRETAARNLGETEQRQAELLGRRGGIDHRERMEAALTRIRQNVPEFATLVIAEAVLARAIERYRDRNKSDLFETASRLFGQLTCGRFVGLELERDENDDQYLFGVRPDGFAPERVPISGMSDGTCDQLYLALRLGHLKKHVTDHGPFPIIIDDLLLSFDDARARAALKCLADLSLHTQVIFFTHHRHLRDMAGELEFQGQIGILEMDIDAGRIANEGQLATG